MTDLSKEIGNALELVKKDWERLPGFIKFLYVTGVFALLAAWLVNVPDQFHGKAISTWLIFLLFISVIAAPGLYWVVVRLRIYFYRMRYPVKNIGKDFRFANLGNAVHIVDLKRKQVRWIENPRTLYDLGLLALAWTEMTKIQNLTDLNTKSIKFTPKLGLRTCGKPGEGKI